MIFKHDDRDIFYNELRFRFGEKKKKIGKKNDYFFLDFFDNSKSILI